MKLKHTKTLVLILLVIGVIFQTALLWLGESSNHNFFYSLFLSRSKTEDELFKLEPDKIMVEIGNMRYLPVNIHGGLTIKAISDDLILQTLSKGKFISEKQVNWIELLDLKSIVYEYPIAVPSESFAGSYGEMSRELSNACKRFDTIIIKPARSLSGRIRIHFVDTTGDMAYTFELPKSSSEALSEEIEILARGSANMLTYISSKQNSIEFFKSNVFLPQWTGESYDYLSVSASNPIEDEDMGLEKSVTLFFDNPIGIISAIDPAGTPFFSDEERVVKYFEKSETLEYTDYSALGKEPAALDRAYMTAQNFLKRDLTLTNNVIMTDAVLVDGVWKLYFDYVINGVNTFMLSDESKDKPLHAIEISVEGNAVSKYKRVVKEIVFAQTPEQITETAIDVLDKALSDSSEVPSSAHFDNMEIAYNIEGEGEKKIYWLVETMGKIYVDAASDAAD